MTRSPLARNPPTRATKGREVSDQPKCCVCGRAEDDDLGEDGFVKCELRPYGPGGADICFQCAMSTPERQQQTSDAFGALLDAGEAMSPTQTTLLTSDGPVAIDADHLDAEIANELTRRADRVADEGNDG